MWLNTKKQCGGRYCVQEGFRALSGYHGGFVQDAVSLIHTVGYNDGGDSAIAGVCQLHFIIMVKLIIKRYRLLSVYYASGFMPRVFLFIKSLNPKISL